MWDPSTDQPICLAGQSDKAGGHKRRWCGNVNAAASLWPLVTPHLRTQYVIDCSIKLRAGASLPSGLRRFQANGCILVEVPPPQDRRLERGGEDSIWEYSRAPKWGENAFEAARKSRKIMTEEHRKLRRQLGTGGLHLNLRPAQIQAIIDGYVPECRVLAAIWG